MKYLSFSSPKGGVGRTLTLSNCAKLYSMGCAWAGLPPAITILADLDFHAPGIHYYDFTKLDSDHVNYYNTPDKQNIGHEELLAELKNKRTGLLFLLTDILKDTKYKEFTTRFEVELKNKARPAKDIYRDVNLAILGLLNEEKFNPIHHMVTVGYSTNNLFIFPAASPHHKDYLQSVYNFNWLEFNQGFGLFLLDAIFLSTASHIQKQKRLELPVRILIDQQAGVSIPSALNRTLADASIIVSGLNWQNKIGLEGLLENYLDTYGNNPWIVLNQYKFRKIALINSLDPNNFTNSPHEEFRRIDDEERGGFVKRLCLQNPALQDRIFLTEFIDDAIQKEHFYNDKELAIKELISLIVSIEKSFLKDVIKPGKNRFRERIVFVGERVLVENKFSGPLNGVFNLLTKFYPEAEIVAIAVTHEDIVTLVQQKYLEGTLTFNGDFEQCAEFGVLSTNIYDLDVKPGGTNTLFLEEIDFISYPHHLKTTLLNGDLIERIPEKEFIKSLPVADALQGTTLEYFEENILRWKEYVVNEDAKYDSIPLFVNFQLLAYHKDTIYNEAEFRKKYRKKYHRNFEGFKNPQDLVDFSELTKETRLNNVLLCGNPQNIAMWYEWQTIFSLFYDVSGKPPECKSIEEYRDYLASEEAGQASQYYLNLLSHVDITPMRSPAGRIEYDWDNLIEDFYVNENKGLIFIWPDAIPIRKSKKRIENDERTDNTIIYQVPPSFHLFEECWQLSIVKKNHSKKKLDGLITFLNYFLIPEAQELYTHSGGLPIHNKVLSSLDIWNDYPFIPPIWSVYNDPLADLKLTKRDSFEKNFEAGKRIANCLKHAHIFKMGQVELQELLIEDLNLFIEENNVPIS